MIVSSYMTLGQMLSLNGVSWDKVQWLWMMARKGRKHIRPIISHYLELKKPRETTRTASQHDKSLIWILGLSEMDVTRYTAASTCSVHQMTCKYDGIKGWVGKNEERLCPVLFEVESWHPSRGADKRHRNVIQDRRFSHSTRHYDCTVSWLN
jgi:hypothetical protein